MQIEKIKKIRFWRILQCDDTPTERVGEIERAGKREGEIRERERNAVCRMLIVRSIFVICFTQMILVTKLFPLFSSFIVPFDLSKCRSSGMLFLIH